MLSSCSSTALMDGDGTEGNLTSELCRKNRVHQDEMMVAFCPTGFELPNILFLDVHFMLSKSLKSQRKLRRENNFVFLLDFKCFFYRHLKCFFIRLPHN